MKRGRKPLPPEKKRVVKMQTRVQGPMAEQLYSVARQMGRDISEITYEFYQHLIEQKRTDEKHGQMRMS